jgi:outer membrane protein OmpA-like peptidoglycan-associated protein
MVTGEPLAVATQPTEVVLFTSGPAASKAAGNTPFTFSGFGSGARPGVESIAGIQYNDEAPVAVKQAQKALEIAEDLKAGDVNPVAMREANTAFVKANSTAKAGGSQKVITDYARRAVELASQAIRDTNRANAARAAADAETRRAEEKSNLEKRAATAENDAERTAALLKEVEAQRAALAMDSKNLALERDKFAAERDAVKADLARVEAERAAVEKERDGLEKMLKESLSSVAETNETARGVIVSLSGILFDLGKATLHPSAQLSVAKLAGILTVFQNMNLSIEGYTDTSGTDEVNMKLSNDRARTVYDFLQAQGIAAGRMKYQGFGPASPVAPNDTEANRAKNRRVEVVLTQAPKQD